MQEPNQNPPATVPEQPEAKRPVRKGMPLVIALIAIIALIGIANISSLVSGSNAYIVGSWKPPIDLLTEDAPRQNTKFLYLVTQGELDQLVAQGWHVWYLPLMREFDFRVYQFDIAAHGARDVRLLHPDRPPGGP